MMPFVDRFLAQKYPREHFDSAALKVGDITSFVRKQATELGSVEAKHMVSSLRSFFRYLRHTGEIDTDLASCIPSVPVYSFSTVPRFLTPGAVEKILRQTVGAIHGRRDCAVLMPLARLGLRTFEIVTLELEDVAWERGQITVRGKVDDGPKCRCRLTSGKPLLPICSMIAHAAQAAACSSVNVPGLRGCKAYAQS
jgi:site-specific recombinase XerD